MDSQLKKEKVSQLWRDCFNDSESFIKLFFDHKYSDENTLTIGDEMDIWATLQLLPYSMTCWYSPLPMAYLAGVSTQADKRNRGLMSQLMKQTLLKLKKRGYLLSTLIPAEAWLFDYYKRFGYATVTHSMTEKYSVKEYKPHTSDLFSRDQQYRYFSKMMLLRSCTALHSRADWDIIIADLEIGGGSLVTTSVAGLINGLAFLYQNTILEWAYDNEESREQLLAACAQAANSAEVSVKSCAVKSGSPFVMARIVDAEAMLALYAQSHPQTSLEFQISDLFIHENNGCFTLNNGICQRTSATASTLSVSIDRLASILLCGGIYNFPSQTPQVSLMLN